VPHNQNASSVKQNMNEDGAEQWEEQEEQKDK
jgi:hypothetical protein